MIAQELTQNPSNLEALRSRLRGSVYSPADEGYAQAKFAWNVLTSHEPGVVVVPQTTEDIVEAVNYARVNGLKIAVQNTGHGQPRLCRGCMLLVVTEMRGVVIDEAARTAKIQAGARWGDVLAPAQAVGLAALSGSSPGVGVIGYTLGGGYNLMLRKYGLAIDLVKSMKVVTADGALRTASKTENAELFWSLLGGGGSFGIIAEMEFGLVPNAMVFGGAVMYPIERKDEVFAAYHAWSESVPEEVTCTLDIMHFPPIPIVPEPLQNKSLLIVIACAATDEARGQELLAPIRSLGGAVADNFEYHRYSDSARIYNDPVDPLPVMGHGVLLRDVDENLYHTILEAAGPMGMSPNLKLEIRQLGGAMARVEHGATAIGNRRDATHLLYMLGVPMGPVTPPMIQEQAQRILAAIKPYILSYGPLNFIGENDVKPEAVRDVFGEDTYERLKAAKASYDPDNLLSHASLGIA